MTTAERKEALAAEIRKEKAELRKLIFGATNDVLTKSQKLILEKIVHLWIQHRHGDGVIHPGRSRLARTTRCSIKTVSRAFERFRDYGILEAVAYPNGGHRVATRYRVDLDALRALLSTPPTPGGGRRPAVAPAASTPTVAEAGAPDACGRSDRGPQETGTFDPEACGTNVPVEPGQNVLRTNEFVYEILAMGEVTCGERRAETSSVFPMPTAACPRRVSERARRRRPDPADVAPAGAPQTFVLGAANGTTLAVRPVSTAGEDPSVLNDPTRVQLRSGPMAPWVTVAEADLHEVPAEAVEGAEPSGAQGIEPTIAHGDGGGGDVVPNGGGIDPNDARSGGAPSVGGPLNGSGVEDGSDAVSPDDGRADPFDTFGERPATLAHDHGPPATKCGRRP